MQIELRYDHRTFGNTEDAKEYSAVLSKSQERIRVSFDFGILGVIGRSDTISYASGVKSAEIVLNKAEAIQLASKLLELDDMPDGSTLRLQVAA